MSSAAAASAATQHLSPTHTSQVLAYLRFFQSLRDEESKEIDAVFEEQKDMRLLDEMYKLDDVTHLLDEVRTIVKQHVLEDMDKYTQQAVLYLRQLFLQAEGNGVALNVDLSQLDDAVLLAGIEKLSVEAAKNPRGINPADLPDTRRAGALKPVEGAVDVRLVAQTKELQEANRSLLAKFEKLQAQAQASGKEASELREQLQAAQAEARTARNDLSNLTSSNKSAQQSEIEALRAELAAAKEAGAKQEAALRAELKAASDTLGAKVNSAPQYQQLKKLMNTKNEQLKEARAKVKELEQHLGKA